jgi:hypothetical protein
MERIRVISGLVWFQAPQVSRDQVRAGAEAASAMITASGADPDAVFAAWQRRKEIYQATLAWESGDDEEPEAETEEQSELSNIAEAAVQSALRVSGAVTGNIGLVAVQYRSGLRFVSSK